MVLHAQILTDFIQLTDDLTVYKQSGTKHSVVEPGEWKRSCHECGVCGVVCHTLAEHLPYKD